MAALDPDNCIKLFRLDDSQDSRSDPETAIIPAQNNMFLAMFHPEAQDGRPEVSNSAASFPDEGVSHLLEIRIELEELFHHCGDISGISDVLWEDISRRLFDRGFNVGGKQCAKKWDSLYSEYVDVAKSDDEGRVSAHEHFAVFEQFFKLRTNHVDSKILEDITQFLSSRFECTTAVPKYVGNGDESSKRSLSREEFSNLSQEEDSQMLNDAINAAQKMLDENLKEDFENVTPEADEDGGVSGSLVSDRRDFYWDTDSEQCFMDLRLYAESSRETKRRILMDFDRITAFVVHKMLLNGYRVSEADCRKKWAVLTKAYHREGKRMGSNSAKSSFWLMDRVLKKYAPEEGRNFEWTDEAVRRLIAIRIPMENAFAMFKKYVILWQYVASQMEKGGFTPTYNECSIRWMELCESFKLCSETLTRRGNEIQVDWTFYQEMRQGYEQNIKKTEATVVDYRCHSDDPSTENSTEATSFASTSNGETLTDFEDSSFSSEKITSIDENLETEESLASISREESNISEETEASDANLKEHFDYGIGESNVFRVWNEEATLLLINLKLRRESKFRNQAIPEADLWKEIATDMQSAGHNVTHQACAGRWYQVKAAYEENVSPKGGDIIIPKHQEHPKPLPDEEKPPTSQEVDGINPPKFVWTDEAVRTLVRLRFSEKMKTVRKYGAPIAAVMRADGYPTIAPTDVSRKWSRIISTYRKASCRYERGETVKWQYFQLVDGYMKGLPNPKELIKPQAKSVSSMIWTPRSAKKLIETKLSLETSFCQSDLRASSSLWEKVAGTMKAEGFPVTGYDCAAEWNLLIGAYNSTKEKICKGNCTGIGKYYVMVDEAINKVIGSKAKTPNVEEPIDFSIPGKRKMDEEPGETVVKRQRIDEPIDQMNLSQKTESSSTKTQLENESDEANDRSKENVNAFVKMEARSKPTVKKEDAQLRILCDQKPCRLNTMIQDKAVNSTEDVNGRWSESATQLLIDLKSQHHRQFPLLPRPDIQWEKVAALLRRLGYNYTAAECSRRWDFLRTMYERKIADFYANRTVQSWTYFDRLEAIYKKRDGLGTILPKKRARDEDEQLASPKKLMVSLMPVGETQISPPVFETLNTAEVEIETEGRNE